MVLDPSPPPLQSTLTRNAKYRIHTYIQTYIHMCIHIYVHTHTCIYVYAHSTLLGGTCASNQPPPRMQNGASARANGCRGRERPTPGRHEFSYNKVDSTKINATEDERDQLHLKTVCCTLYTANSIYFKGYI